MRMNIMTYAAAVLFVMAAIFFVIMEAALDDDVPTFVKLIMPGFLSIGAFTCLLLSSFFDDDKDKEVKDEKLSIYIEPPATREIFCPLCHTRTDEAICPRCGNRIE